jgi:hypothetical protein
LIFSLNTAAGSSQATQPHPQAGIHEPDSCGVFHGVLRRYGDSAGAGWRSRGREREQARQQRITDSIRVADSLRRAAAKMRAEQARKKDTVADAKPEEDMFSARKIVIDPVRIDTSALDSLEHDIDSLMSLVCLRYRGMKRLRKARMPRKLRFFRAQLRGPHKDTADVRSCCEMLHQVQELKLAKLRLILDGKEGDNLAFVNLHMKAVMKETHQLAELMIAPAPDKPYRIKR